MCRSPIISLVLIASMIGCAEDSPAAASEGSTGAESAGESEPGSTGEDAPGAVGSCDYQSPFTQADECREYTGAAWTETDVRAACDQVSGDATLDAACDTQDMIGRCVLDGGTDRELRIVAYGVDASTCGDQQMGCEVFGGGAWEAEGICAGDDPGPGPGAGTPFIQPTLDCRDPLPGEPAGAGPGGQVCTWQAISGATEDGRRFEDYGDCDVVRTQRPYYSVPVNTAEPAEDPRLDDPTYVTELDWVRSQIDATACVCCHADIAPNGPGKWTIDSGDNWVNSFYDSGLAFSAGWIDSTSFGAYAPEDNNGFDRNLGIPSTDPGRMAAFFEAELAHRGRTREEFADTPPFGGPLYDQLIYEPGPCENGERVEQDGTITWTGGPARYVYVLEAGADNPTVPPNLDLPQDTKWRIDVPHTGDPIESGSVTYGATPSGTTQRFPGQGAPEALEPGRDYYLYVTKDVIVPITRCVFTF